LAALDFVVGLDAFAAAFLVGREHFLRVEV
jgi:hypothetical protein